MNDTNRRVAADRKYEGLLALLIFIGGLLIILVSTLKPFTLQIRPLTVSDYIAGYEIPPSSFLDFPRNILLFIPLGFGLAAILDRRGWSENRIRLLVPVCGLLLTLTVESLQHFLPFRQPSVADLVSNTIGAAAGLACFRLWQNRRAAAVWLRETMASPRNTLAVTAIYTLLLLFVAYGLTASVRFYDWDTGYRMMLGNEHTGDRQWQGSVRDLAIFDRALDAGEARNLLKNAELAPAMEEGLLAYYPLSGGGTESDLTGQQPDLLWRGIEEGQPGEGSVQSGGRWLESELAVSDLSEALQSSSKLAVRLTVTTADLDQVGPARIVTISEDPLLRNLTIGQKGSDLVMRYRSFMTGENGTTPQILFPGFFDRLDPVEFIVNFDGLTVEMIDLRSDMIQSVELVPGIAFYYRYVYPLVNMDPSLSGVTAGSPDNWTYRLLFYLVVLLPLGVLLSLPALQTMGQKIRIVLILCGVFAIPVLLELALVLPSRQGLRPLNVATGVLVVMVFTSVFIPVTHRLSARRQTA